MWIASISWSRRLVMAAGVIAATTSAGMAAATTPTLFNVTVVGDDGQPVPGAEVLILPDDGMGAGRVGGLWKPITDSAVVFTTDDVSTTSRFSDEPVTQYKVLARARQFAPGIVKVAAPPRDGASVTPTDVKVEMQKGRAVTVELVAPEGMQLPAELVPWFIPKSDVISTWLSLDDDMPTPSDPVNVIMAEPSENGRFIIQVADDTPELYMMINHPGFLRVWQSEDPLELDTIADNTPLRVELPKPASVEVTFENQYADAMPPDAQPCLKAQYSTKMPGGGGWLVESFNVCNSAGGRTWSVRDIAPGSYEFSVEEGRVESLKPKRQELAPGSTAQMVLEAQPVIPLVVAVDENGTTISNAEGRASEIKESRAAATGWIDAKDGVIAFKRERMSMQSGGDSASNRFAVEVRSPDHAITKIEVEAGSPVVEPVVVKLVEGKVVRVKFAAEDGRAVPGTLTPIAFEDSAYPHVLSSLSRARLAQSLAVGRAVGEGIYEFRIPEDTQSFRVAFDDDDFLRTYCSEPIKNFAGGEVELTLPQPGGLQIDVTLTSPPLKGEDADLYDKYIYSISRSMTGSDTNSRYEISFASGTVFETTSVMVANLPVGQYEVKVRPYRGYRPAKASATVEPETTESVALSVEPAGPVDEIGRELVLFPKIKVTDATGKAITDAQVAVAKKDTRYLPQIEWALADKNGAVTPKIRTFHGESSDGKYAVTVRAPGYATQFGELDLPTSHTQVDMALKRGAEVALQLTTEDGRDIPDALRPSVFTENWGRDVWLSTSPDREGLYAGETVLSPIAVSSEGKGRYTLQLDAEATEPLYVLVHHPGFLRGYQAGPFDPRELGTSGTLDITLPKPAALTATFDLGKEEKAESPVATMDISRSQQVPGTSNWSLDMMKQEFPVTSATLWADDLASGSYTASVQLAAKDDYTAQRNAFSARESVKLADGSSETVVLVYRPFNPDWLKGPYSATVTVKTQDDQPAAGKPYKLTWYTSGYPQQTVAAGEVPGDGVIEFKDLAGVEKESTRDDWKDRGGVPSFDLEVDGQRLGYLYFAESRDGKLYPPKEGTTKEVAYKIPPKVGDVAPDFTMLDIQTSKTMKLSDLKGQVVLLDFWATWCGPCQGPMAENQDIMRKRGVEWKGKATILTVSIDDELETVKKRLDKNDWHETLNAWAEPAADAPDKVGWQAPAAQLYGINSIPTMLLIDQDGVIRQRGHISDIEQDMQALIR